MIKKFINKSLTDKLVLIIPFVFYMFFALYDGAVMCVDSPGYVNMNVFREPVYPLYLAIFRAIFGLDNYLLFAIIGQSLITAYATYNLTRYVKEEYKTKKVITYLILLILLFVSVLNRFLAKRGVMYSNSVLSESLAIPCFLLFFRYILEYLNHYQNKPLIISTILSFVMISTRKQMYISLGIIFCSIIFVGIINKKYKENIIKLVMIVLLVFGSCKLFDYTYTKIVSGVDTAHTSDNRFVSTMIFYTAELEDAGYIKDEKAKELFISIYNACDEKGYIKHQIESSWYTRLQHFNASYDNIQVNTMWPMMQDYVKNELGIDGNEIEVVVDEYNNIFISSLLIKLFPRIIATFMDNYLGGLIITVSSAHSIFIGYSILIYIVYIGLLIYLFIKDGLNAYTKIGILTLFSILLNVFLVSLVIFNQTRYTIYNMPEFYITGLLMLYRTLEINNYGFLAKFNN